MTPPLPTSPPSLSLVESLLRTLLLDYRDQIPDSPSETQIYFVGPWVHDRLLGIQSSTIKVLISPGTPIEHFGYPLIRYFTSNINKYKRAEELGVSLSIEKGHNEFLIANRGLYPFWKPLSLLVFGLSLEVGHLRKGIPGKGYWDLRVEAGTLEEEASRRDVTINALFYNLFTREIEDPTKRGLKHLLARVIRLPPLLCPKVKGDDVDQRFKDDPRKILRVIQLAARLKGYGYGFRLSTNILCAMRNISVHAAFKYRISPELACEHVRGMMTQGPNGACCDGQDRGWFRQEILRSFPPLARSPAQNERLEKLWPPHWQLSELGSVDCLLKKSSPSGTSSLARLAQSQPSEYVWTLAAWTPLATLRHPTTKTNIDKIVKTVRRTFKAKFTPAWPKVLQQALTNMDGIILMIDAVNTRVTNPTQRTNTSPITSGTLAITIRTWGPTWRLQLPYTFLSGLLLHPKTPLADSVARYCLLLDYVKENGVEDANLVEPVLNGWDIRRIIDLKKRQCGPFMKDIFEGLVRCQFECGDGGATKREAEEWFVSKRDVFHIPRRGLEFGFRFESKLRKLDFLGTCLIADRFLS
ncbi:hypothetical protein BDW59DRAFT_160569 [Aspergillus cavernicola]|uniref:Poly A polymerase head domain-containing protein n=1 Tax=Aspergillus cavernicola TaxID=176166 RepID=A0ABR4IGV5_9EURO